VLTITEVNYIRELYFSKGKSYADIIRMTGRNYRTVRKYIEKEDYNEKKHKSTRRKKSDAIRPIVRKWLEEDQTRHHKQRHTAKVVYDRLKAEHSEILQVKERTVRTVVREERMRLQTGTDAFLRLEHPGGEAQVDFGEFQGYEHDTLKKFHELVVSYPKSNIGYAYVTRSEKREALFEGLVKIFTHVGSFPAEIWFDQMSTAALREKDSEGRPVVSDAVHRFSNHYGFKVKFCNANSGHEKGNVENKVGTMRRNLFVPEPVITDLEAFNDALLIRCDELNQKVHYRHGRPQMDIFEEEKKRMIPMNPIPFDTARYESRKVNKYGIVQFEKCRYSVSPKYIGESVTLRIMANHIEIMSKDLSKQITKHPRLFGDGLESIHHIDFIDVLSLRPNALKYSGVYDLLPPSWQEYLGTLGKKEYKQAFHVLKVLLLEGDLDHADRVLRETLSHDSTSPEAIAVTHRRLQEKRELYHGCMHLPTDLPIYEHDLSEYDALIGGEVR